MAYAIERNSSAPSMSHNGDSYRNDIMSGNIKEITVHRRRSMVNADSSDNCERSNHQKRRSQSLTLSDYSSKVDVYSSDQLSSSTSQQNYLPTSQVGDETPSYTFTQYRASSINNNEDPSYPMASSIRSSSIRSSYSVAPDSHNPNRTIAHISTSLQRSCSKRNSSRSTPTPEVDSSPSAPKVLTDEKEIQRRYLQSLSKAQLRCMLGQVLHKLM